MAGCFLLFGTMALQAQGLKGFKAENGKMGFKDKDGKVVIAPKYDFLISSGFQDGLARVRLNRQYGFVDETGSEVIPLQYKNAHNFSEGLAAVQNDGGWLYIDRTGKPVLSLPKYIQVPIGAFFTDRMMFSEGLALVRIDLVRYDEIHNGVARLSDPYRYTYIDKNGKFLIDPLKGYHTARGFNEGMAVVGIYAPGHTETTPKPKYTFGHIDKTGRLAVPLKYEDVKPFRDGLAAVKSNGLWGFVNKEGREIVPPQFAWAGDFNHGYARVARGEVEPGKEFNIYDKRAMWGVIGKDGRAVVPITNNRVRLDGDGMVTAVNGSLETKAHISAYEDFNKGAAARQKGQYGQAREWFQKAARGGHPQAGEALAELTNTAK